MNCYIAAHSFSVPPCSRFVTMSWLPPAFPLIHFNPSSRSCICSFTSPLFSPSDLMPSFHYMLSLIHFYLCIYPLRYTSLLTHDHLFLLPRISNFGFNPMLESDTQPSALEIDSCFFLSVPNDVPSGVTPVTLTDVQSFLEAPDAPEAIDSVDLQCILSARSAMIASQNNLVFFMGEAIEITPHLVPRVFLVFKNVPASFYFSLRMRASYIITALRSAMLFKVLFLSDSPSYIYK